MTGCSFQQGTLIMPQYRNSPRHIMYRDLLDHILYTHTYKHLICCVEQKRLFVNIVSKLSSHRIHFQTKLLSDAEGSEFT